MEMYFVEGNEGDFFLKQSWLFQKEKEKKDKLKWTQEVAGLWDINFIQNQGGCDQDDFFFK